MPFVESQVNTFTVNFQYNAATTQLPNGGWVITWASMLEDGSGSGVYQQVYDSTGALVGPETRVNTTVEGNQDMPAVTVLADGGWVVTWGDQGISTPGVYQQAFNADGTPRGGETQVNTFEGAGQGSRSVMGLADGGWVVSWLSVGQDGSGYGIYQQAFAADGSKIAGETRVNTFTDGNQWLGSMAPVDGGGWVATWSSPGQDGSETGVFQQIYNADGTPHGGKPSSIPTPIPIRTARPCWHATAVGSSSGNRMARTVRAAGSISRPIMPTEHGSARRHASIPRRTATKPIMAPQHWATAAGW